MPVIGAVFIFWHTNIVRLHVGQKVLQLGFLEARRRKVRLVILVEEAVQEVSFNRVCELPPLAVQ
jgi:hypothetical protein